MANIYSSVLPSRQSQREPSLFEKEVQNNAGGFVYEASELEQLKRFLILGTEANTLYVAAKAATYKVTQKLIKTLEQFPKESVELIHSVSVSGRAPKNEPALFALALASSSTNPVTRQAALSVLPAVARTGTHLFHFFSYVKEMRGFGRGLKRAFARWYTDMPTDRLAYQMVKYQQRDGVSHKDLLRLSHPKAAGEVKNNLFKWATAGFEAALEQGHKTSTLKIGDHVLPPIIAAFEEAKRGKNLPFLIETYGLSREMIPSQALAEPATWSALLPKMGLEAMLRNLGNMTRLGVLKPLSKEVAFVVTSLMDAGLLQKSRIHPYSILVALKVYESGGGLRGGGTWTPVPQIISALNEAFHASFNALTPTGKNFLVAVDVSGSMRAAMMENGLISAAEGASALSLALLNTEKNVHVMGFTGGGGSVNRHHQWKTCPEGFVELGFTKGMSLNAALNKTRDLSFGATDCALPMLWADTHNIGNIDCFIILTDNETWAGNVKPMQALKDYRKRFGVNAKLIVVGMTATGFSIADPRDAGSLDVVGFDASIPQIINEFVS